MWNLLFLVVVVGCQFRYPLDDLDFESFLQERVSSFRGLPYVPPPLAAEKASWAYLEALARKSMSCSPTQPGAVLAVTQGNQILYVRAFGFRDYQNQRPVTEDTLFQIGSTTKAMTSAILSLLQSKGKIQWETLVKSLYPTFRQQDNTIENRLTIQDLVSMRTGLARLDILTFANTSYKTPKELLDTLQYFPTVYDFRSEFLYNNAFYAAAGYLGSLLENTTWEKQIEEYLLKPLGMSSSSPTIRDARKTSNYALPYAFSPNPPGFVPLPVDVNDIIQLIAPAGSVASSVLDMTRWLRFLNDGKNLSGIEVMPFKNLEKTWRDGEMLFDDPYEFVGGGFPPEVSFSSMGYASGWLKSIYRGRRFVWHTGGTAGHSTVVARMPDQQLGFVWMTNIDYCANAGIPIALAAFDIAMGYQPWINETTICTFPCPWDIQCRVNSTNFKETQWKKKAKEVENSKKKVMKCVVNLSEYVGVYHSAFAGDIRINVVGHQALVYIGDAGCAFTAEDNAFADTFLVLCQFPFKIEPISSLFQFTRSLRGDINGLVIPGPTMQENGLEELTWVKIQ